MKKKKYWLLVANLIILFSIVIAAIIQLSFAEKEVFAKNQEIQLTSESDLSQVSAGDSFVVTVKDNRDIAELASATKEDSSDSTVQATERRVWSLPLPDGLIFDEEAEKQLLADQGNSNLSPEFVFDEKENNLTVSVPAETRELDIQLTAEKVGNYALKTTDHGDEQLTSDELEIAVAANNQASASNAPIPYLDVEPRVGGPYLVADKTTVDAYPTNDASQTSSYLLNYVVHKGNHPGFEMEFAYGRYPPDLGGTGTRPGDTEYRFTRSTDEYGQITLNFREITGDPNFTFKAGYWISVNEIANQPGQPGVPTGGYSRRVADETKPVLTTFDELKIYEGTDLPLVYQYANTVVDANDARHHSQFDTSPEGVSQVYPYYMYPLPDPGPNYRGSYAADWDRAHSTTNPEFKENILFFQYAAGTATEVLNATANGIPGTYVISLQARDQIVRAATQGEQTLPYPIIPQTGLNLSDPQPSKLTVLERPAFKFVNQAGQPIDNIPNSMEVLPLTMEPTTFAIEDYNNPENGDVKGAIDTILLGNRYALPSGWETVDRPYDSATNSIEVRFEEPPTGTAVPKRVNIGNADYLKSLTPQDFVTKVQDDVSLPENVKVEFFTQPNFDVIVQTPGGKSITILLTDEAGLRTFVDVPIHVYNNQIHVFYRDADDNSELATFTTVRAGLSGTVVNLPNWPSVSAVINDIKSRGYTLVESPQDDDRILLGETTQQFIYKFRSNGSLSLASAPASIDFGQKITRNYGAIYDDNPSYDIPLVVADSRNFGNNLWTVSAKLTEVFTATTNTGTIIHTLPTALKYKNDTGVNDMALNQSIVLAKSNTGVRGNYDISQQEWVAKNNGFIFDIGVDEYREMYDYQAKITYTVQDVYQP